MSNQSIASTLRLPSVFFGLEARFSTRDNVSVIRGEPSQVLSETEPRRMAFLHVDNAEAELGALEVLFDRISPDRSASRTAAGLVIVPRRTRRTRSHGNARWPCWSCRQGRGRWRSDGPGPVERSSHECVNR